jgi:hypothetical protein
VRAQAVGKSLGRYLERDIFKFLETNIFKFLERDSDIFKFLERVILLSSCEFLERA